MFQYSGVTEVNAFLLVLVAAVFWPHKVDGLTGNLSLAALAVSPNLKV